MVDKITGFQALGGSTEIKWGRDVSEAATTALTENNRLRQDFNNTTSSTNTIMGVLSEQIAELAEQQALLEQQQATLEAQQETLTAQQAALTSQGAYLASLVTYATQGSAVSAADNSGSLITSGTTTPQITFTLPQALKCKITLRGQAFIAVSGSASTISNNGLILTAIGMDGSVYGGGQGRAYLSHQPGSGANSNASITTDVVAQVIVDLDAGSHTAFSRYQFQGNGASVNMSVQAPTMTVEVISLPG